MELTGFAAIADVPESLRPFVKEVDGKLDLDMIPGADVVGLKHKNAELGRSIAEIKARFDGIDPEEFKALKVNKGKDGQRDKDLESIKQAAATRETELAAELDKLRGSMRTSAKASAIATAIASSPGASLALLEPVLSRMLDVEEVDGAMNVIVRKADGSIRYRDGAGNRCNAMDLLAELKLQPEYAGAWTTKVGSGGGAQPGSGLGGARTVSISDTRAFTDNIADIASGKIRTA